MKFYLKTIIIWGIFISLLYLILTHFLYCDLIQFNTPRNWGFYILTPFTWVLSSTWLAHYIFCGLIFFLILFSLMRFYSYF